MCPPFSLFSTKPCDLNCSNNLNLLLSKTVQIFYESTSKTLSLPFRIMPGWNLFVIPFHGKLKKKAHHIHFSYQKPFYVS